MIILKNPSRKRDYGFINAHGRDVIVKATKEVIVTEEDLMLLQSTSRTFTGGYLVVKNPEDLPESVRHLFANEEDMFVIDASAIISKLKGKVGEFYGFMKEVEARDNSNEKREVFEIAKTIEDLAMKKARRIEEVTGFDFKREEIIEEEMNS